MQYFCIVSSAKNGTGRQRVGMGRFINKLDVAKETTHVAPHSTDVDSLLQIIYSVCAHRTTSQQIKSHFIVLKNSSCQHSLNVNVIIIHYNNLNSRQLNLRLLSLYLFLINNRLQSYQSRYRRHLTSVHVSSICSDCPDE